MMGTKPSSATLATFCGSLTPSNRRTATYMALAYLVHIEGGPRRPCLKLINVSSVKGYKGWRNFREIVIGEVRHSPGAYGPGPPARKQAEERAAR